MNFAATIYVDSKGNICGARDTDQRGKAEADGRTRRGKPVECAGRWYGSQMSYQPFRDAVTRAAEIAALREAAHEYPSPRCEQ